jgi:LmbE family N-acetylglucosaminyl deacetylase
MVKLPFKKILALSAHTDDIEFGAGGTIHRLLKQGAEVYSAVFSSCEESVPEGFPKDVLVKEMHESAARLGLSENNIHLYPYPVRRFPHYRQEILEDLVTLQRLLKPDLVFAPSGFDVHQDHHVIYEEAVRAFRYNSLFGYELPWNNIQFSIDALIELSEEDIHAKSEAIACYKSQGFRHYAQKEFFFGHAQLRGVQKKAKLAEAFQVIRLSL